MMTEATTRRLIVDEDANADGRILAFFAVSAVLSLVFVFSYVLAPPPDIGPSEGQLAPNISGQVHNSGIWEDFTFHDYIDRDWQDGQSGQWFLIQFMDTDCPYCWTDAAEMSEHHASWNSQVTFITVVLELQISDHDGSRAEIEAFKLKQSYQGCYKGERNCADRPGEVHNWRYFDALTGSTASDWSIPGTPFSVLVQPDGVVAWNPLQHKNDGDSIDSAVQRLVGV
jgi:hypothetical protein